MSKDKPFLDSGPLTVETPKDYDWHVWRRGGTGDTWMGFFHDAEAALDWVKAQPPENYVVNNVPPPTSQRYVKSAITPPRYTGVTEKALPTPRRQVKKAAARSAAVTPVEDTQEAKVLRKQARTRLDKHRKDEAAELAAGQEN